MISSELDPIVRADSLKLVSASESLCSVRRGMLTEIEPMTASGGAEDAEKEEGDGEDD